MIENDKKLPLIIHDCHTKWGLCDTLRFFFSKKEISRFRQIKFWEWQDSWEKISFFNSLWTNISTIFKLLYVYSCRPSQKLFRKIWIMLLAPGGALECNLTGRCPFLKNLHNPFRKTNCISIPCFGIIRLQNIPWTIGKTIVYFSWKQ